MIAAFTIIAVGCGLLATGAWIAGRSWNAREPIFWARSAGYGLVASTLALYLPLLITGEVHYVPALVLYAIALGATALRFMLHVRQHRLPRVTPSRGALWTVLGLAALAGIASLDPLSGYDSKAIYGLKAKALWCDESLEGDIFQDPEVVHYHGDYPLGLPLLMAFSAWCAEGRPVDPQGLVAANVDDWLERYDGITAYTPLATLWIMGILFLLAHAWRRVGGRAGSTGWAVLLVALPTVVLLPWIGGRSWGWEGADLPLTLLIGTAAYALSRWIEEGGIAELMRFGLVVAVCPLFKNDALVGGACLALALMFSFRQSRTRAALAVLLIAGAIGTGLLIGLRSRTAGAPYDEHYFAALLAADLMGVLSRVPELVRVTTAKLFDRGLLAFFLFALFVAIPLAWRSPSVHLRLFARWVLLYLLATLSVFLVTPNQVTWHVATALPRVWCQLAVPAGWLVLAAFAELWVREPSGEERNLVDLSRTAAVRD